MEQDRGKMADGHTVCVQALQQCRTWPDVRLLAHHVVPLGHMGSHRWRWGEPSQGLLWRLDAVLFIRGDGYVVPGILVRPCEEPRFRDDTSREAAADSWALALSKARESDALVAGVEAPALGDLLHLPPEPWPLRRPRSLHEAEVALEGSLSLVADGTPRCLEELPHARDGLRGTPPPGKAWMPLLWERVDPPAPRRGATPAWTPSPLAMQLQARLPRAHQLRALSRRPVLHRMERFAPNVLALHVLAAAKDDRVRRCEPLPWPRLDEATPRGFRQVAERQERRQESSHRRRCGAAGRGRHIGAWAVISGQDVVPGKLSSTEAWEPHRVLLEWLRTPGFVETMRVVTDDAPERCRFVLTPGNSWQDLLTERHGAFVGCFVDVPKGSPGWSQAVALADEPTCDEVELTLAGMVPPDIPPDPMVMAASLRDRQLGRGVGEIFGAWVYRPSVGIQWSRPPSQVPALQEAIAAAGS